MTRGATKCMRFLLLAAILIAAGCGGKEEAKKGEGAKDASAEEKKRLEELQTRSKNTDALIEKQRADSLKELKETNAKWSEQVQNEIAAAIQKVAEPKGINLVLNKDVVLLGGTDITDAVIEKLNKK